MTEYSAYSSALNHFCYQSLSISPSPRCIFSFLWVLCCSLSLGGPSSEIEGYRALAGYEAPWREERDRGRRPRQYICPGESRKTSERFRTQPITSTERLETDRYCSGLKNAWLRVKNAGKYPYDHACERNHNVMLILWYLKHRSVDSNQVLVH